MCPPPPPQSVPHLSLSGDSSPALSCGWLPAVRQSTTSSSQLCWGPLWDRDDEQWPVPSAEGGGGGGNVSMVIFA